MKVYILLLSVLRFCNSDSKEKEEEEEIDTPVRSLTGKYNFTVNFKNFLVISYLERL